MYLERFNMRPGDWALMPAGRGGGAKEEQSAALAWGFYCRFLLAAGRFYSFDLLRPDLFLYVSEVKSVPNRAAPAAGDARGRPLVVAWYEKAADTAAGVHVSPVGWVQANLRRTLPTLARLARSARL